MSSLEKQKQAHTKNSPAPTFSAPPSMFMPWWKTKATTKRQAMADTTTAAAHTAVRAAASFGGGSSYTASKSCSCSSARRMCDQAEDIHKDGQTFYDMLIGLCCALRRSQHASLMTERTYRDGGVIEMVSLLCLEAFVCSCARHAAS